MSKHEIIYVRMRRGPFLLGGSEGRWQPSQLQNGPMKVSVNDFGPFAKDLLGSVKGSLINHILSKKVDEQHHGVKVGKDGSRAGRAHPLLVGK